MAPDFRPLPPVSGASPAGTGTAALSIDSPRLERNGLLGGPYVPKRPLASGKSRNRRHAFVRCGERLRARPDGGYAALVIATHDAKGWWLGQLGPVEPLPALEGETTADVVIVG